MIKNIKISIRISIVTLFLLLLSLVGFTIIGINHLALNEILSTSAQNLIKQTTLLVKERFNNYLEPLSDDLIKISNALASGIIDPKQRQQFDRFLFESIRYNPDIFYIYYGTTDGAFYGVDREQSGHIGLTHIINSKSPAIYDRYELNDQGEIIGKKSFSDEYDSRERPWYQDAVAAGKPVWTDVYSFEVYDKSDRHVPGITSAAPIYDDKSEQLKGVVGLDLTVDGLQKFISEIKVTDNTLIYITDNTSNIIAFHDPSHAKDLRSKKLDRSLVKKYNIPFETLNFNYNKPYYTSYMHDDKEYLFAYHPLETLDPEKPWHINIIVPANDILAPLKELSMYTFFLTMLVLIIGALIARFVAQKISKPIILLADEAKEITQLNLAPRPVLSTIIKEVSYLAGTLSILRSSLASFQRYVPSTLVKKLMDSGRIAKVGGSNQIVTILFADIEGFTHISESTPPQELMTSLSNYFQVITEIVLQSNGTLDKYIGDAVMALWNAPELDAAHARHACRAASAMIECLKILNQKNRKQGTPEFTIRIGIHTGEAVVGNVGSEERLSFTALGDSVNLASRLETINKNYSTNIIVSHATYSGASDLFPFRLLDKVAVRGKQESTEIYELITAKNIKKLNQHKKEFTKAFSLYQKGQWAESIAAFEKLTPAYDGDKLASVYITRCRRLKATPPADWDGIWREGENELIQYDS